MQVASGPIRRNALPATILRGFESMPTQLLVIQRIRAGEPSTIYDSPLEDGRLCASGLTSFGDIGIAADMDVNPVSIEPDGESDLPEKLTLPLYPNPTASTATLSLEMPQAQTVRVTLFNLLGRVVGRVHEGTLQPGIHSLPVETSLLPAGVYMLRIDVEGEMLTTRLTVVR